MRAESRVVRPPADVTTVIFDFDETLVDLEWQHLGATAAFCRDFGVDFASLPPHILGVSGTRVIDELRRMREHFGWTEPEDELLARLQDHFDRLCTTSEITLMPGVPDTVRELHARGFTLAITTSAVASSIDAILRRIDLRERFTLIVDGSEVVHGKPDPECYLLTAKQLGVPPERCIVIEDAHVGVVAAKRARMFCIAVPNPRATVIQDVSGADVVVARIDEVLTIVGRARSAPPPGE